MYILLSCSSAPRPVLRASVNLGANSFLTVTSVAFSCWKHMAALAGGVLFWSRICQTVSQYQQKRFYKLSPALKNEPRHNKMAQWLKTAVATNCRLEFHDQKPHGNSSKLSSDPRNAPTMMNTWKLNFKKAKANDLTVWHHLLWKFSLYYIPISTCTKPDRSTFLSLLRQGLNKNIPLIFLKYGRAFQRFKI